MGVERSNVSQAFLISDSLFLAALWALMKLAIAFVVYTPIYALACYIGIRCGVRRNIVGVCFWIGAWMLASIELPIMIAAAALFDPGHVSWGADLVQSSFFAFEGLLYGTVYCILAFLRRAHNEIDSVP